MAVAFDAKGTVDTVVSGTTSVTKTDLTVGSGANRALVTQLALAKTGVSAITMTWDSGTSNASVALIVSLSHTTANMQSLMHGLVAPISGAKNLKAAWTGNSDATLQACSWTGVDQTGGTTSFPHSASAQGTQNGSGGVLSGTLVITSSTSNATMDQLTTTGTMSAPTQTQTYLDLTPATFSAAGSRVTTAAATVSHGWSEAANDNWVQVGTDIAAVAAGLTAAQEIGIFDAQLAGAMVGLSYQ